MSTSARSLEAEFPSHLFLIFQTFPTIYDILFSHLSALYLIRVCLTCTTAKSAIDAYQRRAFSINRLLSRFVDDPQAFRALQARTGALISGSQALQFFSRTFWPESDLDIFTGPRTGDILEVGRWILGQGYHFTPQSFQLPDLVATLETNEREHQWDPLNPIDVEAQALYDINTIRCVLTFEKEISGTGETRKIQVIADRYSPIEAILSFHSTVVMNFISWNRAYSLYPYATLEMSRSLVCCTPRTLSAFPRFQTALLKYEERGFTTVSFVRDSHDFRCAFNIGERFIGDRDSLMISLDMEGVDNPIPTVQPPDFDRYTSNGWTVGNANDQILEGTAPIPRQFEIKYRIMTSTIFRHVYTAPPRLPNIFFSAGREKFYAHVLREHRDYDSELARLVSRWKIIMTRTR